MRELVIKKTVYTFDELSESAKDKARDWMRQGNEFDAEYIIDDAKAIGELFGLNIKKIYYSGFSSQGDGACFEGTYQYKKGSFKAVKKYAPTDTELHVIVKGLQELQKKNRYSLSASVTQRGHYMHSGCTLIDVMGFTKGNPDDDLKDLLRDYMDWIYSRLNKEYEFQNLDQTVDENIKANGYEFDETGRIA